MQAIAINDDGTTTIEFTDTDSHKHQRLLAMAHGETNAHSTASPCTVAWHAHPDGQYSETCRFDQPA